MGIYIIKLEKMDKDDGIEPLLLILLIVFAVPLLVFTLLFGLFTLLT